MSITTSSAFPWPLSPCAVAISTALVLPGATAHAQDAARDGQSPPSGPVPTLPAVTVTGAESGSLTAPSVRKQQETINQTAGSVGFIDNASLLDRYQANLRDVLQDAPGVHVQTRYGQELRLSIRGSGIARAYHVRGIEFLQDGIPTNLADGSGDYYELDPMALRATEIYKGGNALAYGASTLGGAINFVTPTAYTALAPNIVQLSGGSFGTLQASAQASRVLGNLDFLVNFTGTHADGWRAHETGNYAQFNANAGYRFSAALETRFYLGLYATNQLLPGTLSLSDALNNPRIAAPAALSLNQARNMRVERLANRTSFRFDDGRLDLDSWLIHTNLYHPIFQVLSQDGYTYGIAPRYTRSWLLGERRNELIAGARFFGGNNNASRFINNGGSQGMQTLDSRQNAYNVEAYLENRYFLLPQLALVAGAKALHDVRRYVDKGGLPADPNPSSASASYNGLNPKIGVLWQPRQGAQVFANLTRSRDVPDFTDLTQTIGATSRFVPLASQRAWTAEAGTRGRQGGFGWDFTYYRSWLRGELLQYMTNPVVPASTFNAGRTLHQGIELGASLELARNIAGPASGDRIALSQLWNWSDFRFRGDPQYGDNAIPGLPAHVLRTSLTYSRADGFYLTPTLDWAPHGAWVDYANTLRTPGYALVGLKLGASLREGLSFYVDMRNLGNKRHVADFGPVIDARSANTSVFYPGEGRGVYAGLRYQF